MTDMPLFKRIRAEYMEMPGLRVTLRQAQRLFGLDRTLCKTVFDTLVDEGFLRVNERGMYARRESDGAVVRARSASADIRADARYLRVS